MSDTRYYVAAAGAFFGVYDRKSPEHRNRTGHACIAILTTETAAQEAANEWNKAERMTKI